jgi:ribose 1,5-bisphosphokinase PhnN
MRNVFIVGPSCGGKTSLFHFLKEKLQERHNFPLRVVSRPERPRNDSLENTFLKHPEFKEKRTNNDFFLSWHRIFENDHKEYYAFYTNDVSSEKVNIFSANNALLLYPQSHLPLNVLQAHESSFIACTASEETRLRRLKERSPEYSESEVRVRIHGESIEHLLPSCNLVINTNSGTIEENGIQALHFLEKLSRK